MQTYILLAQAFALLSFLVHRLATCLLYLPYAILRCSINSLRKRNGAVEDKGCTFYEGTVFHERRKPVHNAFRCTHLSCCCDSAVRQRRFLPHRIVRIKTLMGPCIPVMLPSDLADHQVLRTHLSQHHAVKIAGTRHMEQFVS